MFLCSRRVLPIVCRSQVYVRHGTTSLTAALDMATDRMSASICNPCRTSGSWLKMVDQALSIGKGVRSRNSQLHRLVRGDLHKIEIVITDALTVEKVMWGAVVPDGEPQQRPPRDPTDRPGPGSRA